MQEAAHTYCQKVMISKNGNAWIPAWMHCWDQAAQWLETKFQSLFYPFNKESISKMWFPSPKKNVSIKLKMVNSTILNWSHYQRLPSNILVKNYVIVATLKCAATITPFESKFIGVKIINMWGTWHQQDWNITVPFQSVTLNALTSG